MQARSRLPKYESVQTCTHVIDDIPDRGDDHGGGEGKVGCRAKLRTRPGDGPLRLQHSEVGQHRVISFGVTRNSFSGFSGSGWSTDVRAVVTCDLSIVVTACMGADS